MKKLIMTITITLLCIGITACGTAGNDGSRAGNTSAETIQNQASAVANYKDIKPEEAKKRLDGETGIILLDVRTQEEYDEKHIPDSILIPVDVIEKEAQTKLTDKNATIFVYCRSGRRSAIAAEALVKMGYTKVYNLGGINDWPYETETGRS